MAENYNSPGSPYWACLAFICLAVPETHPFWTSSEENHWDVLPKIKPLPQPGHIMSNLGGHCMLLSSGQACSYPMKGTHAKYGAFAYSSAYAYSVPPGLFTLEQYALASQLGLSDDGGEYWKTRRLSTSSLSLSPSSGTPFLISLWTPFPDVHIKTYLLPPTPQSPNYHLRIHRITTGRDLQTADGSFAICNEQSSPSSSPSDRGRYLDLYNPQTGEGTSPKLMGNYDLTTPEAWAKGSEGAFAVSKKAGAVGIRALETFYLPTKTETENQTDTKTGTGSERTATLVNADPNSNLVESRTAIPTLQHTIRAGETVWYVTGVYAKPKSESVEEGTTYLDGWETLPEVPDWLVEEIKGGGSSS